MKKQFKRFWAIRFIRRFLCTAHYRNTRCEWAHRPIYWLRHRHEPMPKIGEYGWRKNLGRINWNRKKGKRKEEK